MQASVLVDCAHDCYCRGRLRVLARSIRAELDDRASKSHDENLHAQRQPIRRLAGTRCAWLLLAGMAWVRGNKKWTRIFLSMLLACAIAGAAARVIKITVGRARPSVTATEIWNGPSLSSRFHAFPSGHTAASTAFFAVLLLANWRIGVFCSPIPLLIGFSRMSVAAHYLSDVVCAAILGILCAMLVEQLFLRKIENRNPQSAI